MVPQGDQYKHVLLYREVTPGAYERSETTRRSIQQRIIARNGIVKST